MTLLLLLHKKQYRLSCSFAASFNVIQLDSNFKVQTQAESILGIDPCKNGLIAT